MKSIIRMIVFCAFALYVTSLWNKGFIIPSNAALFLEATVALTIVYYLILPLSRLILLPLNLLTLGLMSFVVFLFALHIISSQFHLITIQEWVFPGFSFWGITIQKTPINYLFNLVVSSLSISVIIRTIKRWI